MIRLRELAHTRSGDKGNTLNIAVIAYRAEDYERLQRQLTAERVRSHLGDIAAGGVLRYELPNIAALNFVIEKALGGGVTRSTALDRHGKTFSSMLLELELPD